MVNGMVCVSEEIIPERKLTCKRITRATSNPDTIMFRTRKCNTMAFQGSLVNRTARTWNILPDELRHQSLTLPRFKSLLTEYSKTALRVNYISGSTARWRLFILKL